MYYVIYCDGTAESPARNVKLLHCVVLGGNKSKTIGSVSHVLWCVDCVVCSPRASLLTSYPMFVCCCTGLPLPYPTLESLWLSEIERKLINLQFQLSSLQSTYTRYKPGDSKSTSVASNQPSSQSSSLSHLSTIFSKYLL